MNCPSDGKSSVAELIEVDSRVCQQECVQADWQEERDGESWDLPHSKATHTPSDRFIRRFLSSVNSCFVFFYFDFKLQWLNLPTVPNV